ncbi:DUF1672 family protein, partial [Bacillus haynesii]|nr:DUF1672 family protein [Bacillus haynesii]
MKFKKISPLCIGITFILGGCMNSAPENQQEYSATTKANSHESLIRVQDYTGQGYALDGGQATAKIAEAHHEEIEKAVKAFFLDKYKTKVRVHNIVGA